MFVRYKGKDGILTNGKIYIAHDLLETGAATGKDYYVMDEDGNKANFRKGIKDIEFLEYVYAVNVKDLNYFEVGKVYKIIEIQDADVRIENKGWVKTNNFEIIDSTNLLEGMKVRYKEDWWTLKENSLWEVGGVAGVKSWLLLIETETKEVAVQINEVGFWVVNGSICFEPIVYATDNKIRLTKSKPYKIIRSNQTHVYIIDDTGVMTAFLWDNFSRNYTG